MFRAILAKTNSVMLSSIFLNEDKLFEPDQENLASTENAPALINYFFAKNFHVLRKEICQTAAGAEFSTENPKFIQALYDLHCDSRSSENGKVFTPQILKWHLKRIRKDFRLYLENTEVNTRRKSFFERGDDESSDREATLNISRQQLIACISKLHALLWIILQDEEKYKEANLAEVSVESLIASRLDWNEAYEEFQEAFSDACLTIKGLINNDTLVRYKDHLHRVKEYLVTAKSYSSQWETKIRELKEEWTKLKEHEAKEKSVNEANQSETVLILDAVFSGILENAEKNLKFINDFFQLPLLTRQTYGEGAKVINSSQDIFTYHEFQMHFWLKAKFLFKGLELKKDQKVYEAEFSALAEAALKKAEIARKTSKVKVPESAAESQVENIEDKSVPAKDIDHNSLEQHERNMAKLHALNTDFLAHIAALKNAVTGQNSQMDKAVSESKASNVSAQDVNLSSQTEFVRPKLFINTEDSNEAVEKEHKEYDAFYKNLDDFVKTPMAVNPRIPGHARRFSTFFSISEFRESVGHEGIDEELNDSEAESGRESPSP